MTEHVIEMPRCCSTSIQSEVAWRALLRDFTVPAIWIAPPYSSSFSVSVVLPASGCEMMANVRRRDTSRASAVSGGDVVHRFEAELRMRVSAPRELCRQAVEVQRKNEAELYQSQTGPSRTPAAVRPPQCFERWGGNKATARHGLRPRCCEGPSTDGPRTLTIRKRSAAPELAACVHAPARHPPQHGSATQWAP